MNTSGRRPIGHRGASEHRERWAVSYADLLTILLVFFVAGAAQISATKPTTTEPPPSDTLALARQKLEALGVETRVTPAGLIIRLPQTVHFANGDDTVPEDAIVALGPVAAILRELPNRIRLAGNADSTPIRGGRFNDNWELAAARGLNLLDILAGRYGLSEQLMSVETFGPYAPRETNDTEAGRAENRRVEILILN